MREKPVKRGSIRRVLTLLAAGVFLVSAGLLVRDLARSARERRANEQLAQLAAQKGCVYLDLWGAMADGEGNLKEVLAAPDGVHFSAGNGYGAWVTCLRNHAKYASTNAWTLGSAYAVN